MRIGTLAQHLGTTPHAVRFYERHGLLPPPERTENGYREYSEADVERLRLLIGLRQLDLSLGQSAQIAALCAEGRCEQVSVELLSVLADKRVDLRRRIDDLRYLDRHLAHLEGDLAAGEQPRHLITPGKVEPHDKPARHRLEPRHQGATRE